MQLDLSLWAISIFLMIVLTIMAVGYTIARTGQSYGFPGKVRYATFGVMSFLFIGMLFISYIAFLFLMEGINWSFPYTIGPREYDLANGFFTVLVGAAIGIFLGIFALLKKREMYGK